MNLSLPQLKKRNNFSLFKQRIVSRQPFLINESNGKKVKINSSVAKNINSIEDLEKKYKRGQSIILPTNDNKLINLTSLYKDSLFSGREQNTTKIEDAQVQIIKKSLIKIKDLIGGDVIRLQIGANTYNIVDVESTPGTPRSDFNFIDINGNRVGFVSHKDGSGPQAIQQWGGTSISAEPIIASHPETRAFVETLKEMYPNGLPSATTVARKIKDNKLKMLSVYGSGYGGPFGIQNVNLLLQGTVSIQKINNIKYKLNASSQNHKNGDLITGNYEPVLMAIYKGDRNNYGIKGARIVISAIGGRLIKAYV